jgi:hypothetical protein
MQRADQKKISFIMTAVYLLLTLSPLVSIGMQSKPYSQALSRECSGDCRLCGCSAERSASHACCCWQKKLAEAKKQRAKLDASCATATTASSQTAGSCCQKPASHEDHDNEAVVPPQADSRPEKSTDTVSISTCPCGSGKDLAFSANEKTQHIPFRFASGIPIQPRTAFSFLQPERLSSRYDEPPDPPPKVFIIS